MRKQLLLARNLMQEKARDEEKFEEERKAHEQLKSNLAVLEAHMKAYEDAVKRNKEDLLELEESLKEQMPKIPDADQLRKNISENEVRIQKLQEEKGVLQGTAGEFLAKKRHSAEVIEKIARLNHCPMCLQDVTGDHKERIKREEQQKIDNISKDISSLKDKQEQLDKKIEEERKSLHDLESQEKDLRVILMKKKNFDEKKKKCDQIRELIQRTEKEMAAGQEKKEVLKQKIIAKKDVDSEISKAKKELDLARQELHRLEVEESRVMTEIRNLDKTLEGVKGEVKRCSSLAE